MQSVLNRAFNPESFREMGHELVDLLANYLSEIRFHPEVPVLPPVKPEELLQKYRSRLNVQKTFKVRDLFDSFLSDSIHLHHSRYVGHQVCPPVPLGALASMAGALLNNGSAIFEMGPANTAMEKVVIEFICQSIGYPASSDGVLTSGGSLGNLTALLALKKVKAGSGGGRSEAPFGFLVSEAAHYSVVKALKIMGFSNESIIRIPVDRFGRMEKDGLESVWLNAKESGLNVIGMIANACTTATGVYDNLDAAADFSEEKELWLHVDGAHGVAAVFSNKYRHRVKGIERADSLVIDFHKMFLAPALVTAVLFRNALHSHAIFAEKASYLWAEDQKQEWFNFSKRTIECTKLSMGLRLYAILEAFGSQLFAEQVDQTYDLARDFATLISEKACFELAQTPQSNIVCFRFVDIGTNRIELDQLNAMIRERIVERGRFYLVQTDLDRGLFLRTTLMNPFTRLSDLALLLEEIEATAVELRGS